MSIGLIILIAVAVVALLLLVGAIRIVREYERVVVFRPVACAARGALDWS